MKVQEEIIFEDLKEFLEENGIKSEVLDNLLEVVFMNHRPYSYHPHYHFYIHNCLIVADVHSIYHKGKMIVSLADPQYREKFLKYCLTKKEIHDKIQTELNFYK